MLLLSRPYPDEPISGALVRGCRHYLVPMKQMLGQGTPGHGKVNSMPLFGVSPLPFFAELFDIDPRGLLARHTVLPFVTAFSEHKVWSRAVASSLAGTSGGQAMGAVIQSAIHGIPYRRTCAACVADDIRTRGESFWRLSHQLPGSIVCHVHGEVLRTTKLSIAGSGISYELPQDCSGRRCLTGQVPDVWHQVSARIAELAARGLAEPMSRTGGHYRELAIKRGWLRSGREVNTERLTEEFVNVFGQAALKACGVIPSAKSNWVALMLQPNPHTPFATLRHVLVEQFLAGTPSELSHKPSGPSPRPAIAEDKALATAFARVAASYATKEKRARVADVLQAAGCSGPYRHRKASLPRLRRAVEAFQTSERAFRPQALQSLVVPGNDGVVATRQDLVKAGHLISSRDAASRFGIPWYDMKPLQRSGRILSVRYASRDWYPAFWFDGRMEPSKLEDALGQVAEMPLAGRWAAMVRLWASHCPNR